MVRYTVRRLLLLVPTFLGVTLAVFALTRLLPGGPLDAWIAAGAEQGRGFVEVPPALREELTRRYGLDRPLLLAWLAWLRDLASLDLGRSFKYGVPVASLLAERLPVSAALGAVGFALSWTVCVPLGVARAARHGGAFDRLTGALVLAGFTVPGWALGALLLVLLGGGSFLDLFPLGGLRSDGWAAMGPLDRALDLAWHAVLPVVAYSAGSFASLTELVKGAVRDALGQDHVRTALAKGLSPRAALVRHALGSALVPLATSAGRSLAVLAAGSYLIETVFNVDGLGRLGYTALVDRDYAVVMGILAVNTALVLAGNLLADLLCAAVDPRVRLR